MKLSENLKRIRKENNLSQEQLAEKLNVSRQAVSKWESGQSYPEMEKVLLICKLFDYNMDELMNENVKEVSETQESKNNFNKYIEDFFSYITKTVDMFSCMKFKQKFKCIFEQIFIILFLFIIFFIIGCIGSYLFSNIFSWTNSNVFYTIRNIIEAVFTVFGLVFGTMIFLHIFKIRYLDYFEIVREKTYEENYKNLENKMETNTIENSKTYENKFEINSVQNYKTLENNIGINSKETMQTPEIAIPKDKNKKIFLENKMERIIIRDPVHSESKFLTGIMKCILCFIKLITGCFAVPFIISFISIVTLLALSFMFIKTGILFFRRAFYFNCYSWNKLYHFRISI